MADFTPDNQAKVNAAYNDYIVSAVDFHSSRDEAHETADNAWEVAKACAYMALKHSAHPEDAATVAAWKIIGARGGDPVGPLVEAVVSATISDARS